MCYSKIFKFESHSLEKRETYQNNQINKHKSQCITNEWPEAPASIGTEAEALGPVFNSTIEHFYGACALMAEKEDQEEQKEQKGEREKEGREGGKESAWDLAVVIWLNHNLV